MIRVAKMAGGRKKFCLAFQASFKKLMCVLGEGVPKGFGYGVERVLVEEFDVDREG